MTVNSTPFRSIDRTTKWLVRFTVVSIILATISFAFSVSLITTPEYNTLIENIFGIIGNLHSVILLIVVIITLIWYYWANKNIHSFGAKEVTSPIMAVIWWFIPIANLWKPYYVTQQIWKASNPEINLLEGTEWRNVSGSNVITIWWILTLATVLSAFIFGFGFGIFVGLKDNLVDSEPSWGNIQIFLFAIIMILISVASIIVTIYFIRIVRRISSWQDQKSKHFV